MRLINSLLLILLFGLSSTVAAKHIQIKVHNKYQMVKDLRLIQLASAGDTVILRVRDDRKFSKHMICRYVKALKNTKARVKLREIPREVIRHARNC